MDIRPSFELEQLYTRYYSLLHAIAYRMIGSYSEAQDMVHDVFEQLAEKELAEIQHIKAYLIRAVTNRCLNVLQSARKRRELYPGPWLPEPDVAGYASYSTARTRNAATLYDFMSSAHTTTDHTDAACVAYLAAIPATHSASATVQQCTIMHELDGEQALLQQEQISYAVMVMLEQLNPLERAVFVLRESFQFDYADIASYVHKSEVACRKMLSRIRGRLQLANEAQTLDNESTLAFTEAFLEAARSGNFTPLLHKLREDITMYTDGGGNVRAALRPILTRYRVTTFLTGIASKGAFTGQWSVVSVNGTPGLQLRRDGAIVYILAFAWDQAGHVQHMYMISNPAKLAHIDAEASL
ncbi:sigma-70 family RNA polymerase sigma factor [Paenibacillus campi]|uniref:sigma-70 family RNA polymerase sigma factor n=1 Tax=Paenibacillus campi TaxID=3106031 RepID=UPI002AFF8530|nr:sigma-70 family RNA polymerase sigma factor [Paenibacillus sp. SGZ-1014]